MRPGSPSLRYWTALVSGNLPSNWLEDRTVVAAHDLRMLQGLSLAGKGA